MSTRGEQLMALRNLLLPTIESDGAKVSGSTLKAVLRTIDDFAREKGLCWASVETIAKETCLSDKTVRRSIRALSRLGYISAQERNQGKSGELSIDWRKVQTSVTITEDDTKTTSVILTPTSVTLTKTSVTVTDKAIEPIRNDKKRDSLSKLRFDEEDLKFSKWMFSQVRKVAPKTKEPNFDKWANVIRITRSSDGHSLQEIRAVFVWANGDSFWRTNILSPEKLRKQFSVLDAKMTSPQGKSRVNLSAGVHFDSERQSNGKF